MTEPLALASCETAQLRRSLRRRLARFGLSDDFCLEGVLGADAPIDLVACDADGRVALLLVARAGGELASVALAMAQRAFVSARLTDWKQLAPDLRIRTDLPVRAIVLGQDFGPQARAAAASLGEHGVELWRGRALRNGAGLDVWVEAIPTSADPAPADGAALQRSGGRPARATGSTFRTGLGDADLGLSPEEIREFD